jgi:hypothetical protein
MVPEGQVGLQWGKPFYVCFYWRKSLKIFLYRTSGPISIKLDTSHPCIKEIQVCTSKGPGLFKGEIIAIMQKIGWDH